MNLLAPWFLAGLAAIGVPIMVHLIQKERKEVIHFPSLMFLSRIPYQAVRRQKIRHWLLLLMRCAAILLLVMAFARPFFLKKGGLAGTAEKMGKDVVFLIDRSYSMEYGDRWRRAVDAAKEQVNKLEAGDRGIVVYFNSSANVIGQLTGDKRALLSAIDSVKPTAGVTRYDVALRAAQRIFGDTARPKREIVLVSDYQRTGWATRDLPALPPGATLTNINLSDTVTSNLIVTRAETRYTNNDEQGQERVIVTARVVNRSARPVTGHTVKLVVADQEKGTKQVDIAPNGTADVEFDEIAIPPGVSQGFVRADADSLQRDNVYNFVVARQRSLPVMLVQAPEADTMTGLFLTKALAVGDRPSFDVKVTRPTQISAKALEGKALVILNDVPFPGGDEGRALAEYVRQGGGLLVALGNNSAPGKWPSVANELVPRPDGAVIDRTDERGASLGFIDRAHPVFEVFNTPRSGDFSSARFFRYWPVTAGANDRQLARFGDSRVALLERRVGAGRVLLWTSDLDGLWNDVPLQPVFLPFLRQATTYLASYRDDRLAGTVGQVLSPAVLFGDDAPVADSAGAVAALRKAGAGAQQYVVIRPSGKQDRFGVPGGPRTLELNEQGFYQLKRATGADTDPRLLPVNIDLTESDLVPLNVETFAAAVAPRAGDETVKRAELLPQDVERRQNVWWYLLIAALLLLASETLLSNRLSRSLR